MRYDAEHKATTRRRLLKVAAGAIRDDGPHNIGVAAVMAKAGLTHGGFYAHFASKEALVVAALEEMFGQGRLRLRKSIEGRSPADGLATYIDFYLSPAHRDNRAAGCAIAALSSDLPRLDHVARARFAAGIDDLAADLAIALDAHGIDAAADVARSTLAELVGALSLARVEPDAQRSDALLAASRRRLRQRLHLENAA
jgi:TetR/AcrR family transcriptional repressor of nem operon